MSGPEQRGLELAATARITRKGRVWGSGINSFLSARHSALIASANRVSLPTPE
jgi:hypothetical protein